MSIVLTGLLIGICLILAGFTTLLRVAFAHLSHGKIDSVLIMQQDKIVSALIAAYFFFLISAVILITHYLLGGLNNWQIGLHCVILLVVLVPLTDLFPRAWLLKQPEEFSLSLMLWVRIIAAIFTWPAKLLAIIGQSRSGLFDTAEYYPLISRYYESSAVTNSPEKKEYDIQKTLSHFITLPVTEFMIRMSDLKVMDVEMPVEELITAVFESNASRVLLYQDNPENIVGILHSSLLMKSFCLAESDKNMTDVTSAISEPVFIDSSISVFDQFRDFSSHHEQFALIRDKGNILRGAISMEIILDRLFGELRNQML